MNVKPIRTEADHKAALRRCDELWEKTDQASIDELDVLGTLICAYEDKVEAIDDGDVDPVDMLEHLMEAKERTQADLGRLFGSRSRAADVLNRKRMLTLNQIRLLQEEWNIPADLLVVAPKKARRKAKRATRKTAPARARKAS